MQEEKTTETTEKTETNTVERSTPVKPRAEKTTETETKETVEKTVENNSQADGDSNDSVSI